MKRLNPETGKLFKHGDIGEDGRIFWGYRETSLKSGQREEKWLKPENFYEAVVKKQKRQKENSEYFEQYRKANREKAKRCTREWQIANPDKVNEYSATRNLRKQQRTPPWLTKSHVDEILSFYKKAKEMEKEFGGRFEVDHIVPIHGKLVSGLHVPWNLQILTKQENIKKGNKHD